MTEKHKLEPTRQRKTLKKHVNSMSWHLRPRYGHVTMVRGYAILTVFK